jgi:AraC family transcriptional regulator
MNAKAVRGRAAVKIANRYIRPLTVLYARSMGPYATATRDAWRAMGSWLDARDARSLMRISYGLFRDDPSTTGPELLRYDACVPLVFGLEEDAAAGIRRQTLPGGAYAVQTHTGAIEATGETFSQMRRNEVPARGLQIDSDRPFLAIYLTDPTVTLEKYRRTELCVPIVPILTPMESNDDAPLIAPEVLLAIA